MTLDEQFILHEGLRLHAYTCPAGYTTIGVGRNLDSTGISREEALLLLHNDIARIQKELKENLPYYTSLDEVRQRVLLDMVYNMGIHRFLRFQKMLAALAKQDYVQTSREMLKSMWAKQVGERAIRLARWMRLGVIGV